MLETRCQRVEILVSDRSREGWEESLTWSRSPDVYPVKESKVNGGQSEVLERDCRVPDTSWKAITFPKQALSGASTIVV